MNRLLVVPAGGRSVRMGGLLKELLPVGARPVGTHERGLVPIPVLRHTLECGLAAGVDHAVVVTSSVKAYAFMEAISTFALPLNVTYVHQPEPLGIGAAILCAEPLITCSEATLMLMPDAVIHPAEAVEHALELVEEGAMVAVTLHLSDEPERFGVARVAGGRALGFVDKPTHASSPWIWTSVAFKAAFLSWIRASRPPGREWGLTEALDLAARQTSLGSVFAEDGSYHDVGTYHGYLAALAQAEVELGEPWLPALESGGAS